MENEVSNAQEKDGLDEGRPGRVPDSRGGGNELFSIISF